MDIQSGDRSPQCKGDAWFQERVTACREPVKAVRAKAATLDPALVKALEQMLAALDPYLLTSGIFPFPSAKEFDHAERHIANDSNA